MKRIHITESQLKNVLKLKETINQTIDRKPGESIDNAIKNAAREVKQDAPSADVNFVISGDEVNEDVNDGTSVPQQVVDFILNNYKDIDCDCSVSELNNAIQDAYIECFGEEMEYDNKALFREIRDLLIDRLCATVNESVAVFTKKQIKEAKKNKKIAESTILTKSDILKGLR